MRSVYYAIFESHLSYVSIVWSQNTNSVKRHHLLQKKYLRIMFFQSFQNFHQGLSFKVSKILKSFDKTGHVNCIFLANLSKGYCLLFSITGSDFPHEFSSLPHQTTWSNLDYLKIPLYYTKTYGRY